MKGVAITLAALAVVAWTVVLAAPAGGWEGVIEHAQEVAPDLTWAFAFAVVAERGIVAIERLHHMTRGGTHRGLTDPSPHRPELSPTGASPDRAPAGGTQR